MTVTHLAPLRNDLIMHPLWWPSLHLIRNIIPENPCLTPRHRRALTTVCLIRLHHRRRRHRMIRTTSFMEAEVLGDRLIQLLVLLRILMTNDTMAFRLRIRPTDPTIRPTRPVVVCILRNPFRRRPRVTRLTPPTLTRTMKTIAWRTITTVNLVK